MDEQKRIVSEFAIASLVMGAVSFITIFNVEKPIVAIVFGILALERIGKNSQLQGKKFAIIGIILGVIALVLLTILAIRFFPQLVQLQQHLMRK